MRLFQVTAILVGFGIHAALAAGPYWHRSVALDYSVSADGTSVASEVWEVRADTAALAHIIAQQSYSVVADLERVELVAAYTRKADGRTVPVPSGSVMDQAVTTSDSAPQFSAAVSRTILFPQVTAGDTVHYELRRVTTRTLFPGEFTLAVEPGGAFTIERADISIALPPARELKTAAFGLEETSSERRAEGGTVRRWRLAPNATGPVAIEASTLPDYPALGRAYAARAASRSGVSPAVQAIADELAPPGLEDREAARRLYSYVRDTVRYVATFLGDGRVVPRSADSVLAEGWGDCKDHAALLQALLAAKGIEAVPVLISLHNRYTLPAAPGLGVLDHVITYVPSLDLYLDSTASYAPFGVLLANEYDKPVVLAAPDRARLARTPPMPSPGIVLETRTEARIAEDGMVSGTTTTAATGPQSIALRSMAAWFERRGAVYSASSQLQLLGTPGTGRYAFEPPESLAADYRVEGRFSLDDPLAEDGAAPFAVPSGLGVFGRPGKLLVTSGVTEDGGHVCYPGRELEEIALELPPGARVARLPAEVEEAGGGARYTAHYEAANGMLRIRREFTVETKRQLCREAEFAVMQSVLAAAGRDQRARISLLRDPAQRVASGPAPTE